ncbi:hypothetical protein U9M48_034559 [Paspalum notatum var. saurae]|uniref:riboflavin kinase n=1 Tax=Paspalum notatum var. saurae TaxID=547442 RepID=A0AAQ3X747_PASNO
MLRPVRVVFDEGMTSSCCGGFGTSEIWSCLAPAPISGNASSVRSRQRICSFGAKGPKLGSRRRPSKASAVGTRDSVVSKVVKPFLVKNGKTWDTKKAHKLVGKTPYEAAAVVLEDYGLPYSAEEFLSMITPMFSEQWCNIKPLPGANRLIKHLKRWKECFSTIVGGDEVEKGKPSPDIVLEAAKRMNTTPSNCLVIEDSLPGVAAGKAAEMCVIAVPSVPKKTAEFSSADEVINSLLDIRPEKWVCHHLMIVWIEGTLPIEPWFIGGPVIKGFGRGSKVLGIPTVLNQLNIWPHQFTRRELFRRSVRAYIRGILWLGGTFNPWYIYKMVMSIGWNPYFDNSEKTVEPWLLHNFGEDFYGEELRLAIVGYIRPEANFPSLESLIERIHEDGRIAEKALDLPMYAKYKDSPYLRNPLRHGSTVDGSQTELNSK